MLRPPPMPRERAPRVCPLAKQAWRASRSRPPRGLLPSRPAPPTLQPMRQSRFRGARLRSPPPPSRGAVAIAWASGVSFRARSAARSTRRVADRYGSLVAAGAGWPPLCARRGRAMPAATVGRSAESEPLRLHPGVFVERGVCTSLGASSSTSTGTGTGRRAVTRDIPQSNR